MLDLNIQRIWNELSCKNSWRTLALVPTSTRSNVSELACAMAQIAARDPKHAIVVINALEKRLCQSSHVEVVNLCELSMAPEEIAYNYLPRLLDEIGNEGKKIILVFDDLVEHPYFVPIVRTLDASIVCVHLGDSLFARSKKTVEMIGRNRIIGCITFRD
jgi:hypothetical protein